MSWRFSHETAQMSLKVILKFLGALFAAIESVIAPASDFEIKVYPCKN